MQDSLGCVLLNKYQLIFDDRSKINLPFYLKASLFGMIWVCQDKTNNDLP